MFKINNLRGDIFGVRSSVFLVSFWGQGGNAVLNTGYLKYRSYWLASDFSLGSPFYSNLRLVRVSLTAQSLLFKADGLSAWQIHYLRSIILNVAHSILGPAYHFLRNAMAEIVWTCKFLAVVVEYIINHVSNRVWPATCFFFRFWDSWRGGYGCRRQ